MMTDQCPKLALKKFPSNLQMFSFVCSTVGCYSTPPVMIVFLRVSAASFRDADVLGLAKALKMLTESCRSSLTELSVSVLPYAGLLEFLLDANPHLTSLHVEIQTAMLGSRLLMRHPGAEDPDMPGALKLLPK